MNCAGIGDLIRPLAVFSISWIWTDEPSDGEVLGKKREPTTCGDSKGVDGLGAPGRAWSAVEGVTMESSVRRPSEGDSGEKCGAGLFEG